MSGKNDNPTMKEVDDFLRELTGDVFSLVKEDFAVLMATVKGAPERLSDVAERIKRGRIYLRSLDYLYEAADNKICSAAERA
jgi:hypothetical protein